MADLTALKSEIQSIIKTNGTGQITAAKHQKLLLDILDALDAAKADTMDEEKLQYILDPFIPRLGNTLPSVMFEQGVGIKEEYRHKAFFAPVIPIVNYTWDDEAGEDIEVYSLGYLTEVYESEIVYNTAGGDSYYHIVELETGEIMSDWG